MRRSRGLVAERHPMCRWYRCRRPRLSGWRHYPRLDDILPLSPLQEGLLFHALYDARGPDVYTVQLTIGLEGPLDADVLKAALRALLARHASLRAGFRHEEAEPAGPDHRVVTGTAVAQRRSVGAGCGHPAGAVDANPDRGSCRHFDLAVPPLIRFTLVRLDAAPAPACC